MVRIKVDPTEVMTSTLPAAGQKVTFDCPPGSKLVAVKFALPLSESVAYVVLSKHKRKLTVVKALEAELAARR